MQQVINCGHGPSELSETRHACLTVLVVGNGGAHCFATPILYTPIHAVGVVHFAEHPAREGRRNVPHVLFHLTVLQESFIGTR